MLKIYWNCGHIALKLLHLASDEIKVFATGWL